jgi:hypothetical protein
MRLLIDRGADPGGNIGACRLSNGEPLLCDFWRASERNGDGLWSDLVARKILSRLKRRMLDRALGNGRLETGELTLAQDNLDQR